MSRTDTKKKTKIILSVLAVLGIAVLIAAIVLGTVHYISFNPQLKMDRNEEILSQKQSDIVGSYLNITPVYLQGYIGSENINLRYNVECFEFFDDGTFRVTCAKALGVTPEEGLLNYPKHYEKLTHITNKTGSVKYSVKIDTLHTHLCFLQGSFTENEVVGHETWVESGNYKIIGTDGDRLCIEITDYYTEPVGGISDNGIKPQSPKDGDNSLSGFLRKYANSGKVIFHFYDGIGFENQHGEQFIEYDKSVIDSAVSAKSCNINELEGGSLSDISQGSLTENEISVECDS